MVNNIWQKQILFEAMPLLRFEQFSLLPDPQIYHKDEIAGTSFDIDEGGELRCPT